MTVGSNLMCVCKFDAFPGKYLCATKLAEALVYRR